jgi:hypothetical protein
MKHIAIAAACLATIGMCLSADLGSAIPIQPRGPHVKLPGPGQQDMMLGTWATQLKYAPGPSTPNGAMTSGQEVWRIGPGGTSLIEEYFEENAKGGFREFTIAWWDEQAQGQRFLACDNERMHGCEVSRGVARWEGSSLVYTEESKQDGAKLVRQEIFTDITPTSFTQLLKEGPTIAALRTTLTIHARKLKANAAPMVY